MSLRYILAEVAAEVGLSIGTASEKAWLTNQINKVAEEIYTERDLAGCEREQLFQYLQERQVVALPSHVGEIRGSRLHATRDPLPIHDLRPRYKSDGWTEDMQALRLKGKFATSRDIDNAAPVTLTIEEAEAADFSVVISGSTVKAHKVTETITFTAGETEKISTNGFIEIAQFGNLTPHEFDVTMTDADENELAVLPNIYRDVWYHWIQVQDPLIAASDSTTLITMEVLYKMTWQPMVNDYDDFLCPGYDDAIIWQTIGHILAKTDADKAALALAKARKLLASKGKDGHRAVVQSANFVRNPTLGLFDGYYHVNDDPRFYPGGYPN